MGNFYMESTQINYRRDDKLKTVDQKLQELSETSAIDTDIAPVFKSTNTYQPGDMVYYRNKLYVFNVEHTGAWAAADVTATDVTSAMNEALDGKADYADLAGAFSAEISYSAGDLVIYNGIVYRCTNDHTGAWDADDFSATTIAAELDSLKSGLTNVNVALALPENTGKNVLPYTLSTIKQNNSSGTWVDNAVTINGVTFTITASGDKVTKISATRVSASESNAILELGDYAAKTGDILSGCPIGGSNTTYKVYCRGGSTSDFGEGATIAAGDVCVSRRYAVAVFSTSSPTNLEFYPMIRPATITDPTFAPYIPSVESRLEAVESSVTNINTELNGKRIRYDGGTAWPGTSLEFTVSKGNDFAYHFVAIASTASDTTSQSGYLVIRNDNTVLIVDQIGSFTASYNGTTGVLTITLPSSGYWDYRFERVASRLG